MTFTFRIVTPSEPPVGHWVLITPSIVTFLELTMRSPAQRSGITIPLPNIFHNLHLFANPIDENKPKKIKDKNLIYFGPGIHTFPGDTLNVPSGKTVIVLPDMEGVIL